MGREQGAGGSPRGPCQPHHAGFCGSAGAPRPPAAWRSGSSCTRRGEEKHPSSSGRGGFLKPVGRIPPRFPVAGGTAAARGRGVRARSASASQDGAEEKASYLAVVIYGLGRRMLSGSAPRRAGAVGNAVASSGGGRGQARRRRQRRQRAEHRSEITRDGVNWAEIKPNRVRSEAARCGPAEKVLFWTPGSRLPEARNRAAKRGEKMSPGHPEPQKEGKKCLQGTQGERFPVSCGRALQPTQRAVAAGLAPAVWHPGSPRWLRPQRGHGKAEATTVKPDEVQPGQGQGPAPGEEQPQAPAQAGGDLLESSSAERDWECWGTTG